MGSNPGYLLKSFLFYFFDTLNNLLIYFNTALGISVLLNIPKFFEAETSVSYEINASGENVTNTRIGISDIRIHPSYITYYTMWTRLLATGIFPLGITHILRKQFEGGHTVSISMEVKAVVLNASVKITARYLTFLK